MQRTNSKHVQIPFLAFTSLDLTFGICGVDRRLSGSVIRQFDKQNDSILD